MPRMRLVCQLVVLFYVLPSYGAIFKCEVDGKVSFSQQSCGDSAEEILVKKSQPPRKQESSSYEATKMYVAEGERRREIKRLKKDNEDLEFAIDRYERAMDDELQALSRKKQRAANNSAGALWEQSISQEMNAITGKYNGKIQSANAKISRNENSILRLERENR